MAVFQPTNQAVFAALALRLNELGHALSPSHLWAVTTDVIAAIQANNGTVVADAGTDSVKYPPPPHNKF